MNGKLLPSFVVTVALSSGLAACGGAPKPPEETPIPTNPPGPDGEPGIGDGAGPPPEMPSEPEEDDATDDETEDPMSR